LLTTIFVIGHVIIFVFVGLGVCSNSLTVSTLVMDYMVCVGLHHYHIGITMTFSILLKFA